LKVVTVDKIKAAERTDIIMKTLFGNDVDATGKVTFGTVVVPPGARIPHAGVGSHRGSEYSLILRGAIRSVSGGQECRLSGGQASFIPAGEEHWCCNDSKEDCEIVWVLIED